MTSYEIFRKLDHEASIPIRSDDEYENDLPGALTCQFFHGNWEDFKAALEADNVDAILEARAMWGLPTIG